jgi:hypothetical protein
MPNWFMKMKIIKYLNFNDVPFPRSPVTNIFLGFYVIPHIFARLNRDKHHNQQPFLSEPSKKIMEYTYHKKTDINDK